MPNIYCAERTEWVSRVLPLESRATRVLTIKGSVECQMNFCTLSGEMGTLPEVKDDEENSSGRPF